MQNKGLNTKQVGGLFGVDESTVRRWASSGKINCNTSAGGHRKFSFKNIIEFSKSSGISIKEDEQKSTNITSKNIKKGVELALKNNYLEIESILVKLYLNGTPLTALMDDFIESILVQIQKKLDNGIISVAEEHIARKIVSTALNNFKLSVIDKKGNNKKNILCLNLENDIPDIPIDMISLLLESIQYNVYNCGSHTSTKDINKLLSNKKYDAIFIYLCDRQCCTSTLIKHIDKTNKDLKEISFLAEKYDIKLFLGGPYFKNINKEVLKKYNTFKKYSEVLTINKHLQ
tara:strand:- start:72 stop:935 length:864 start_codon:yes stop_codon:yes gene_type:complete